MFGAELRKHRKLAGIQSQQALADILGCTQEAVSHWETGTHKPPSEVLLELSNAVQMPPLLIIKLLAR